MPIPIQKFREIVFQLLYSYDMGHAKDENMIELLSNELAVTKGAVRQAQQRVQKILEKQSEIDDLIAKTSYAYEFERIQSVERNILRIGTFELLFDQTIPPKVAIAEAMRLTRKFSTKAAATFVNAILDAIHKSRQGHKFDIELLKKSTDELMKDEETSHIASLEKKAQQNNNKA